MGAYRIGLGDDTERYIRIQHGYIEFRFAPGYTCEIVNIEVEAEHRGKGIGRALVKMLREAMPGFAKHIYAITRANNLIAQEFYEKCGFYVVGNLRRFYGDDKTIDAVMYGMQV